MKRTEWSASIAAALLSLLLLGSGTNLRAATYSWSSTSGTSWSTTTNWTANGTPGSAGAGTTDVADLSNLSSGNALAIAYDAGASGYLGALTMVQTATSANTTLTLKQNLTLTTGTSTIYGTTGNEMVNLGGFALTIASGATLSLGDATAINPKGGAGAPVIAGTGSLTVNGTVLATESASASSLYTPFVATDVTLGATGTLQVNANATAGTRFTTTGSFTTIGGATVSVSGTTSADTLYLQGLTNTIASGTVFSGFSATVTSPNLWLNPYAATQTTTTATLLPVLAVRDTTSGTSTVQSATTETFSSSATSGGISNAVNSIWLYNTATYGTLVFSLGSDLNLVAGSAPFTFSGSGSVTNNLTNIDLNGHKYDATASSSAASFVASSAWTTAGVSRIGIVNSGASSISGGNGVFKAAAFDLHLADIGIGSGVILQATAAGATLDLGRVSGGTTTIDPNSTLYYTGAGTATLKSTNARAVGTLVVGDGTTASTLFVSSGTAAVPIVAQGTTTVNAGSTVDLHGSTGYLTTTGLQGAGTVTNFSGSSQSATLTINAIGTNTFSGKLTDTGTLPSVNLVLGSGYTGTQILSGTTNNYHGTTTINGGLLLVTGQTTGAGAVAVNGGGALGGAGGTFTTSGVTVASGGGLNVSGGGLVTAGTLTLALGSGAFDVSAALVQAGELKFVLGSNAGTSDKIVLSSASSTFAIGTGLLSLADFTLTTGSTFGAGTYILVDTASSSGIVGSLASSGLTGTLGGFSTTLALSTDGSGNQDLVLNVAAVPEPGTLALSILGTLLLGLWARRRFFPTPVFFQK